jgi:hypothetical protein
MLLDMARRGMASNRQVRSAVKTHQGDTSFIGPQSDIGSTLLGFVQVYLSLLSLSSLSALTIFSPLCLMKMAPTTGSGGGRV